MLIYEVLYIYKWTKIDKMNIDKHKSKVIRYSFDGVTTGTVIICGFLYLSVFALEMLDKSIKNNLYVVILIYALLTIA